MRQKKPKLLMSDFTTQVKSIVSKIPKGKVATYKEVAIAAGNPRAARAVANVMKANYDQNIPCHRVIRTDGGLGGYNRGGTSVKKKILVEEGVVL
jgi:O-6-methylguanine DNA methyltransferase